MTQLIVKRIRQGNNSTLSELSIAGQFVCFGLEDRIRKEKIPGQTAIPAGTYPLKLRKAGGMHDRYTRLVPKIHQGMIEICAIPNFTYVYIHMGNNHHHTAGCLLVGNIWIRDLGDYMVHESRLAYLALYQRILQLMEEGELWISIQDPEQFF